LCALACPGDQSSALININTCNIHTNFVNCKHSHS